MILTRIVVALFLVLSTALMIYYPTNPIGIARVDIAKGNFVNAVRVLRPIAKVGNPEALYLLAYLKIKSFAFLKDLPSAEIMFRRSANAGYWPSMTALSQLYIYGFGVSKSVNLASVWTLRAGSVNREAIYYFHENDNESPPFDLPTKLSKAIFAKFAASQGDLFAQYDYDKIVLELAWKDRIKLHKFTLLFRIINSNYVLKIPKIIGMPLNLFLDQYDRKLLKQMKITMEFYEPHYPMRLSTRYWEVLISCVEVDHKPMTNIDAIIEDCIPKAESAE